MPAKYELKNDKIIKNGYTMFLDHVLSDLQRKSYLESERLKQLEENKEDYQIEKSEKPKTPIDLISLEIERIINKDYKNEKIIFFISHLYDEKCYILTLIVNDKYNDSDSNQSTKIYFNTNLEKTLTLLYNRTT